MDFRGKNDTLYNFLSSCDVSLNVRIHFSDFWLHHNQLLVHGSFITQAHIRVGNVLNATVDAFRVNEHNYAWDILRGVCGSRRFKMGPHKIHNCSQGASLVSEYSSVTVLARGWVVRITVQPIYDRALPSANASAPHHRLDIRVSSTNASVCANTHGILGASFVQEKRGGRLDSYPTAGEFTTTAMGEGALDGVASDYEMRNPFQTHFRFSSFGTVCDRASAASGTPGQATLAS